jgi:hypothetical protein
MMIYYVAMPFAPAEGGGLAPGRAVVCATVAAANCCATVVSTESVEVYP